MIKKKDAAEWLIARGFKVNPQAFKDGKPTGEYVPGACATKYHWVLSINCCLIRLGYDGCWTARMDTERMPATSQYVDVLLKEVLRQEKVRRLRADVRIIALVMAMNSPVPENTK